MYEEYDRVDKGICMGILFLPYKHFNRSASGSSYHFLQLHRGAPYWNVQDIIFIRYPLAIEVANSYVPVEFTW